MSVLELVNVSWCGAKIGAFQPDTDGDGAVTDEEPATVARLLPVTNR